MKVDIPFMERFREPMLAGKKTWTSRIKRYGNVGDTFEAFGQTFTLTSVSYDPNQTVWVHQFKKTDGKGV